MAYPSKLITHCSAFLAALTLFTPLAVAQHFTLLYSFNGLDGEEPISGLVIDSAGNLYGTTALGGKFGGGTVFEWSSDGTESVFHSFGSTSTEGYLPVGLVRDATGNLYGTLSEGGTHGYGNVFKLDTAGNETTLYSFSGGSDGSSPGAGVILDSAGNLYGTTQSGGDLSVAECFNVGCGVVFKLDTAGNETVLHTFEGGSDGIEPEAALLRDKMGNLYGTTVAGGTTLCSSPGYFPGCGITFRLTPGGRERVLYTFTGGLDGAGPNGLIQDSAGNLYGMASLGGDLSCSNGGGAGCGVVFKLSPAGQETVLHTFAGGSDGAIPYATLIRDSAGNLFGTTSFGGTSTSRECSGIGCGTVFKLDSSNNETIIHNFNFMDGYSPLEGLVRDQKGNLYGTTTFGGNTGCNCGVVFELAR
jgi:uncharacterized repeat protein (TIGR03803 family)